LTLQFEGMMSADPAGQRACGFQRSVPQSKIEKKPREDLMRQALRSLRGLGLSAVIVVGAGSGLLKAQEKSDPNTATNPYRMAEIAVQLPNGRKLGAPIGVEIDHSDGKTLWIFERCGGDTCVGSTLDPVMKLDGSGKVVTNFGGGLVNWPHGFYVDRAGDVWVTDGRGENGKGHTVIKFSPDGKVLMTLGKPGQAGNEPGMLDTPSDVVTAPNGDIFIADGHGVMQGHQTNDRIVKLSKDGTFIKAWGKHGSGPGEFDVPHSLALDSAGRLYVADRSNSRVQVFDADGKFIADWKQFGRPSSVAIDKNDTIYVSDSQSDDKTNPGFKQGIRIGSVKDGKVAAFIPLTDPNIGAAEEIGVDDQGTIFAGFTAVGKMALRKFVKN
jgi:DNA-binding beta-propeller fold protein YncE